MSTLSGTINDIHFVAASGSGSTVRKIYQVVCSFTQSFTAADIAQLVSVDTAIKNTFCKNGKTFTVRDACMGPNPGAGASDSVYAAGAFTNSSGTLTFGLGSTTVTAIATGPISGVSILVVGDES